jgi:hypothetical protein
VSGRAISSPPTAEEPSEPLRPGEEDLDRRRRHARDLNLYVTEVANDRSQMFKPKKDADPAKLIRPMVGRTKK